MNPLENKEEQAKKLVYSEPPASAAKPRGSSTLTVKIVRDTVRWANGNLSFKGHVDGDDESIPVVVITAEDAPRCFRQMSTRYKERASILGLLPASETEALYHRVQKSSKIVIELDD